MPREKHWPRCVRSKREVIRFSAGFWDCRSRDNLGVGGRGPSSGSPASMIESPCCLQPRAPCALISEPAMARRRSQRPAAAAAAAAAHASAHLAPCAHPWSACRQGFTCHKMATKTYLVTGASRGVGVELCKQLAARPNAHIVAAARRPEQAAELQASQACECAVASLN